MFDCKARAEKFAEDLYRIDGIQLGEQAVLVLSMLLSLAQIDGIQEGMRRYSKETVSSDG